jgi:hypothetical protein
METCQTPASICAVSVQKDGIFKLCLQDLHWHGLLWHLHANSDSTEPSGESGLVHPVYPVPSRGVSGECPPRVAGGAFLEPNGLFCTVANVNVRRAVLCG